MPTAKSSSGLDSVHEKKDRITRRIEVKSKGDIDGELKGWLKKA
jgi:hypothetical protein